MSYTIIRPKDRNEWLKHRESGIGSSEVGTILGLNPFETPYQLWRRKKGLDAPKQENFAMKAGHYLEDAVSLFYRDETGKEIIKASAGDWLIVNNEKTYLRVSPDRTFWIPGRTKSDRNKGILECKTTQWRLMRTAYRSIGSANSSTSWALRNWSRVRLHGSLWGVSSATVTSCSTRSFTTG